MDNTIVYTPLFIKKVRTFSKKHSSLVADLEELEKLLINNPKIGADLGSGLHKIRLAVKSKGKGKSGGYRVITYLFTEIEGHVSINMITLYDKSEESTVNKQFLLKLLKELFE